MRGEQYTETDYIIKLTMQRFIYLRGAGFTEGARVKTKETTIVTFIYTLDPVVLLLRQQE